MEKKTIGGFIGILRKAKGMTQQELADCLNVSNKAVSRWERGESSPDLALISVIAELFGVTTDELLRGEKNADGAAAASPKSEKQIKILAGRTMGAYTIKTVISILLVITGCIAGLMLIYGLRQFLPGMGMIAIFIIGGMAFQIIALAQTRMKFAVPELAHPQITQAKTKAWSGLLWVLYLCIFAVLCLLPLWSAYKGQMMIPFSIYWLGEVPLWFLLAFLICLAISMIAPVQIIKKEGLPEELAGAHKANSRLKLICLGGGRIAVGGDCCHPHPNPSEYADLRICE